eukprot:jgi/Botrbrau1/23603/Bobra.0838s0001.1
MADFRRINQPSLKPVQTIVSTLQLACGSCSRSRATSNTLLPLPSQGQPWQEPSPNFQNETHALEMVRAAADFPGHTRAATTQRAQLEALPHAGIAPPPPPRRGVADVGRPGWGSPGAILSTHGYEPTNNKRR